MSKYKIQFKGNVPQQNDKVAMEPYVTEVVNQNDAEGASKYIKFWKGTVTQYSMLTELDKDTIYIVEQEI